MKRRNFVRPNFSDTVVERVLDKGVLPGVYAEIEPTYPTTTPEHGNCLCMPIRDLEKVMIRVLFGVEQIYVNTEKLATTVMWKDGEVTVVKQSPGEQWDVYNAVSAALAKKVYGSNTAYKKMLKEKVVYQGKKKKERDNDNS